MRPFSTALLLLFSFILSAQTTYKCTYADTMTVRIPAGALNNMTFKINGDLPDNTRGMVDSMLRKQFFMKPLVQLQERTVTATVDSTIIELDPNRVVGNEVSIDVPYHKMVMKGGKITSLLGSDNMSMDLPPPEERRFVATGARRTILSYQCAEYQSGLVTIWVAGALPSTINPGIKNVDVPGAILGFTLRIESSTIVSEAQAVHTAN